MVKLTSDLIQQSLQFINPAKERELDLRGYKIPLIENTGATLDQFDTIDFSDNDIRRLDGFALLPRLKCLLLNNNRIIRIGENLHEQLPNLESVILTGNNIQELSDLEGLTLLPKLSTLSLLNNPVTKVPHYRLYIAYKLPSLRLLDFCKIKMKDREEANALFTSKKGKDIQRQIVATAKNKAKTFVPGEKMPELAKQGRAMSNQEVIKIREAIRRAKTLDEVERLSKSLQSGQMFDRRVDTMEIEEAMK